jgi:hypothetical protein
MSNKIDNFFLLSNMVFGLFDCDHIHVLFWLSYELLTWNYIVWWKHGEGNEQNVWRIVNGVLILVMWSLSIFPCEIF